jgi:TetR/AcrR family transcriptional regulator
MTEAEKNRRDAIVAAALKVFAEQGFHRASIKQVAAAAGLKSPSLIYWYFKDKNELLYAVMSSQTPILDMLDNANAIMDVPPEVMLPLIGRGFYSLLDKPDALRAMRIFLSEAIRAPETVTPFTDRIMPIAMLFIRYFDHQIAVGNFKPHDTQSSLRAFIWALYGYLMTHEFIPQMGVGLPDAESYLQQVVAIFLQGLRP